MKLEAKTRLTATAPVDASREDPVSTGEAFDTMIDGTPDDQVPLVQRLTRDDGGLEPPDEQPLLNDDLAVRK